MRSFPTPRRSALLAIAAAATFVAGCGGDDNASDEPASSGGGDKPATVSVPLIVDATGPIEAFIKEVRAGWDLRMKEAEENDELEGTKVETEVLDSRFDAKAAANHVSQVARGDQPLALYGTSSGIAPAIAPIAQRSKLPMVYIFSGGPGVVEAGDYNFRVTAPQSSYHQLQSDYFKSQGVKRLAIIYNSDFGTVKDLAEGFYKEAAGRDGYEIVESTGISATATDTASEMTGIINAKADAVLLLTLGQQISTAITQLRRANYDGIIATHPGLSLEGMKSLGKEADGVVWPTDFTPATENASGQKFVEAFEAANGRKPEAFAASGYDAATMVLLALKRAKDFSRESVKTALQEVTSEGFDSASGPLKFEERDARVEGAMVEWKDGEQTLLQAGS